MRIALHSVSYGGVWPGQVTLPIERVIAKAREFGADGIMLMAKRPHGSVLDLTPRRLDEIRGELERHEVVAACIAGYTDAGAGWDFPDNPYWKKGNTLAEWGRGRTSGFSLIRVVEESG